MRPGFDGWQGVINPLRISTTELRRPERGVCLARGDQPLEDFNPSKRQSSPPSTTLARGDQPLEDFNEEIDDLIAGYTHTGKG